MVAIDMYIGDMDQQPVSYYERVLESGQLVDKHHLKQEVFKSMDKLEGWCTKAKASVLVDLVFIKSPQTIVEIGVFGGKSLVPMAYALKAQGSGKIYGIDPWESMASAEGMDGVNHDYWSAVNHEKIYRGLVKKLSEFGLEDQVSLIRSTSEAAPHIDEIDLLHIDGNHSEKASYIDVTKWVPQVKKGGLIIFDDVNWSTTKQAVEWLNENCIKLTEFSGDNIWGVWIKP